MYYFAELILKLAHCAGIEPAKSMNGIEPTHPAYKTGPLPLRIKGQCNYGGAPGDRTPMTNVQG